MVLDVIKTKGWSPYIPKPITMTKVAPMTQEEWDKIPEITPLTPEESLAAAKEWNEQLKRCKKHWKIMKKEALNHPNGTYLIAYDYKCYVFNSEAKAIAEYEKVKGATGMRVGDDYGPDRDSLYACGKYAVWAQNEEEAWSELETWCPKANTKDKLCRLKVMNDSSNWLRKKLRK